VYLRPKKICQSIRFILSKKLCSDQVKDMSKQRENKPSSIARRRENNHKATAPEQATLHPESTLAARLSTGEQAGLLRDPAIPLPRRRAYAKSISRAQGNRHLQRVVEGGPVQRQDGGAAPRVGTGVKNTFKSPKLEIPINKSLGPIELDSVAAYGEFNYEVFDPGQAANAPEGTPSETQTRTGATAEAGGGVGVQGELQRSWEDSAIKKWTGFTPQLKAGGELTTAGGELGVEGALEGESVSTSLRFTLIGEDFETAQIEFATLTWGIQIPRHKTPEMDLGGGVKVKADLQEKYEAKFKPDYIAIGRWIAQRFLTAAAGEVVISGAFIAGGVMTIVGFVMAISEAEEMSKIPDQVAGFVSGYAKGYQAAMRNENAGGGGAGYAEGFQHGKSKIEESKSKVPAPVLVEEARKRDLFQEGVDAILPTAKERALQEWQANHWFDT
jgi:hypothetical protein